MEHYTQTIEMILRMTFVYMFIFILFILNVIAISSSISSLIEIPFILMFIYYWSIYRPTLLPPFVVFLIGICFDLLSGLPLGLSAFILVIVRQLVCEQRIFLTSQTFIVVWLGFILVCALAVALQWVLFGLINLEWTPLEPAFRVIVAGIMIFPVVALVLNLSHKLLPDIQDQYTAVK